VCEESRTTWAAASWWGGGVVQRNAAAHGTKRNETDGHLGSARLQPRGATWPLLPQTPRRRLGARTHSTEKLGKVGLMDLKRRRRRKKIPCDPAVSNTVSRTAASSRKNAAALIISKKKASIQIGSRGSNQGASRTRRKTAARSRWFRITAWEPNGTERGR
jgi:hypothetical protein